MEAISINRFVKDFLSISEDLTNAELRMLYLIITNSEVSELTQHDIGRRIQVDRRTVNIGLKKLKKLKLITEERYETTHPEMYKKLLEGELRDVVKEIPKRELGRAIKYVLDAFVYHYQLPSRREIVVNEDFFSALLGDSKMPYQLRHKPQFITDVIRMSYPTCTFYFDRGIDSYKSENEYHICNKFNYEIRAARKAKRYYFKRDELLQHLKESFSISEREAINVIRENFRKIRIIKNRIEFLNPKNRLTGFRRSPTKGKKT